MMYAYGFRPCLFGSAFRGFHVVAQTSLVKCNVRFWHLAETEVASTHVRSQSQSGLEWAFRLAAKRLQRVPPFSPILAGICGSDVWTFRVDRADSQRER